MNLTKEEERRVKEDHDCDGFFNIICKERIGRFHIAFRETRENRLGLIGDDGKIVLPMIYDAIEMSGDGLFKTMIDTDGIFSFGLVSSTDGRVLCGADYQYISLECGYDSIWGMRRGKWYRCALKGGEEHLVPQYCIPLDNPEYVCLLKQEDGRYFIECRNSEGYSSQKLLRNLVRGNKIELDCRYYRLKVVANVYGQVVFCTKSIESIINGLYRF